MTKQNTHQHLWKPLRAVSYDEDWHPILQYVIAYCDCGKVEMFKREFEYKTRWLLIAICVGGIILCTVGIIMRMMP